MKIAILILLLLAFPFLVNAQTQAELESLLKQTIALLQQLIAKLTVQLQALLVAQQSSQVPMVIAPEVPQRNEVATATVAEGLAEAQETVEEVSTTTVQIHQCSVLRGDDFLPGQIYCDQFGKGIGDVATSSAPRTHRCSVLRGDDFLPGQTVCGEDGRALY